MKQTRIFGILLAMAPAMLTAQETAPAPSPAAAAAPAAEEAPVYECEDQELEARLADYKAKAEAGDAEAAKQVYIRYALAGHTKQGEAWSGRYINILTAKAEAGDVDTMYRLGMIYLRGADYVYPNTELGVKWLYRAMEKGNPGAALILGEVFARQGNPAESKSCYAKAFEAYGKMAEAGDVSALYWQGTMLVNGQGVERNAEAGIAKLDQAAEAGDDRALEQLFRIYVSGTGVEADLARALEYARTSADKNGNSLMAYAAACMLIKGQGCTKDEALGDQYLDKAAAGNIPGAILYRATRLKAAGKEAEAFPYFNQGASMGDIPCLTEVGLTLLHGGAGQEQDEPRGLGLLMRASDSWDTCQSEVEFAASATAAYELARYYEGKDESSLAETWYVIASTHGHPASFAKRGLMHLNPFSSVNWDPTSAYRWWLAGKERGDETCKLYVNIFYFVFTPLLVVLAFIVPAIYVRRINKKRTLPAPDVKPEAE